MGTRHGIMEVLNRCYFEPAQGCTGFMVSPIISASLSSEFHPETKMKKAQPGKEVNLTHAQGLIHFRKIMCITAYFSSLFFFEAGLFSKDTSVDLFTYALRGLERPPPPNPHQACVSTSFVSLVVAMMCDLIS